MRRGKASLEEGEGRTQLRLRACSLWPSLRQALLVGWVAADLLSVNIVLVASEVEVQDGG